MSIFDVYSAPTTEDIISYDSGQEYVFTFSYLEDSSIEVYEIITVNSQSLRYLVPVQDYVVVPARAGQTRYPVSRGGTIRFTRRHSSGATSVSIERNTLIDQTVDLSLSRTFNPRQIEIMADKATMIAQELVVRKCNASAGELDLTQKVTITQYDDLKGSVIDFMVDKITAILLAIDQSADDCRATPEDT